MRVNHIGSGSRFRASPCVEMPPLTRMPTLPSLRTMLSRSRKVSPDTVSVRPYASANHADGNVRWIRSMSGIGIFSPLLDEKGNLLPHLLKGNNPRPPRGGDAYYYPYYGYDRYYGYNSYYSPYRYGAYPVYTPYGFFYYDPFWGGGAAYYGHGGYYSRGRDKDDDRDYNIGSLRLKVNPSDGEVFGVFSVVMPPSALPAAEKSSLIASLSGMAKPSAAPSSATSSGAAASSPTPSSCAASASRRRERH